MKLRLNRHATGLTCTIGDLYVDGAHCCNTLEDPIREDGRPVAEWKVKGDTAIPAGLYSVVLTESVRFKRVLPLVENVPGFEGIRIHAGNTSHDTEGCILVGEWPGGEFINNSRNALATLLEILDSAEEPITIEVVNPKE